MSQMSYYLVNHTLSEFCRFDNNIPLFDALDNTLAKWPEWKKEHILCIVAEEYSKHDEVDILLYERGYSWMDMPQAAADAH